MANRHVLRSLMLLLTIGMKIMVIQAIATRTTRDLDYINEGDMDNLLNEIAEPDSSPEPEPESNVDLHLLATTNSDAIKKLAGVMSTLIAQTSTERCQNAGSTTEQLTSTIRDGFTVIVDAIQDLNTTLNHYKAKISKKAFGETAEMAFQNDGPCPHPFILAEDQCLYIETERLRSFDAARQACIEMGAKLAEFDSFNPFINFVNNMDLHGEAEIYLGGTDAEQEGTWKWLSGARIQRAPWDSGEPNNGGGEEHCLSYKATSRKINDIPCSWRREYACIKK